MIAWYSRDRSSFSTSMSRSRVINGAAPAVVGLSAIGVLRGHGSEKHPLGQHKGCRSRRREAENRDSIGHTRGGVGGLAEGLDLVRVGGDQLATAQQAEQAGRVVGVDDGDLVEVPLRQP